jgi:hypothetical protein
MLKSTFLLFAILKISLGFFSQDLKVKCEDNEIECKNGNKSHFEMVMYCPYEEVDTVNLPVKIKENVKKYLVERIGNDFYNELNFYSSQVIDFKKYKKIKKEKGWISKKSDRRIKYSIQYYFNVQDNMRYYITTVLDEEGNIISKDQLPNYKINGEFDKIISICRAKLIAEQDVIFPGKLLNISLEYIDNENSFVWRIENPSIEGEKSDEIIHRFILINAVNGQTIKRETEVGRSVCNGVSF